MNVYTPSQYRIVEVSGGYELQSSLTTLADPEWRSECWSRDRADCERLMKRKLGERK